MFDIGPSNRGMNQPQFGSPGMRMRENQTGFNLGQFNQNPPQPQNPTPQMPPQMKNPSPNFGGFFSGGMQHTMPVQPSGGMNFGSMSGGGAPKLPWMFGGMNPQTLQELIQRFSGPRIGM